MLQEFTKLSYKEKLMILKWRNHPEISQFMINKKVELNEHLNFIDSLKENKTKKYFLVDDIGVIDFNNITDEKADIGLYKNPSKQKVGSKLMNELINYGFNELKLKKLILYVYENNEKAINLYQKFNFKEVDKKDNLIKMELINENRKF
jgi:UDP-4-amino-4,6-dideoxy-N-acetyl-beta-L-altrosamine N-acetyltransferase